MDPFGNSGAGVNPDGTPITGRPASVTERTTVA